MEQDDQLVTLAVQLLHQVINADDGSSNAICIFHIVAYDQLLLVTTGR